MAKVIVQNTKEKFYRIMTKNVYHLQIGLMVNRVKDLLSLDTKTKI